MAGILILGTGGLTEPLRSAIGLGMKLGGEAGLPVRVGLIGAGLATQAEAAAQSGAAEVLVADDARFARYLGDEVLAAALALVAAADASLVIVPADANGSEWGPRLAARLGAGAVSGCIDAWFSEGQLKARRALAGGSLHAVCSIATPVGVIIAGAGMVEPMPAGAVAPITPVTVPPAPSRMEIIAEQALPRSAGPELKSARVVVSGGMGIGGAANWHLVEDAAAVLEAAVGASRAAVEVGWAKSTMQVGFSGIKVKPDLYLALGISGAVHHLAGIGGAKRIVAINNDAEANIFKASHLGVVGDVKEVIPAFVARLRELTSQEPSV